MHFFPPEHYITGNKLYYKFDPKVNISLINLFIYIGEQIDANNTRCHGNVSVSERLLNPQLSSLQQGAVPLSVGAL